MKKQGEHIIQKVIAILMAIVTIMSLNIAAKGATSDKPREYYYKGHTVVYPGEGKYISSNSYRGGWLWLTKYKDVYYLKEKYLRCLSYYSDAWIANQKQNLSITSTIEKSSTIQGTVSSELGIGKEDVASIKIGAEFTTSITTTYSKATNLTYDLGLFSHDSYNIAAMGYICKFNVRKYEDGILTSSKKTKYAFDNSWGYEIRLVYRY